MSGTPVYGFNAGYNLSASSLDAFSTPSEEKIAAAQTLYTPNIINMNPLQSPRRQGARALNVGAMSYTMGPYYMRQTGAGAGYFETRGPTQSVCKNASAKLRGASQCMDPKTGMCTPPPVPSQCPKGHIAVNQYSAAVSSEPSGVTWGLLSR
jgi:hypothetical protein